MSITQDTPRYQDTYRPSSIDSGPTFGAIDILGGLLAIIMILGPMTAGATHASHQGWTAQQSETR